MNQMPKQQKTQTNSDLEIIKEHEEIVKKYKEEEAKPQKMSSYKHLAYKVKNPFKGI